jgi:cysteinyl-tRNA synthetase
MSLRVHNNSSRTIEPFVPLVPGQVGMYVCGITVYDFCHLGHARSMIAFDVIRRWLEASDYQVTHVRNITDIDDKIIRRAQENGESIRSLTDRMIAAMHQDTDVLGVLRPHHEPRAMDHIGGMLNIIQTLATKGLAYQSASGDVHYAVRGFAGYG